MSPERQAAAVIGVQAVERLSEAGLIVLTAARAAELLEADRLRQWHAWRSFNVVMALHREIKRLRAALGLNGEYVAP